MIYKIKDQLRFGDSISVLKKIPVGNWLVMQDELTKEFFLEKQSDFTIPTKVYGDEEQIAQRYVETFKRLDKNLGILLVGQKGNGKTLTAKIVCMQAKLPVLLITQPFRGDAFQAFLAAIKQQVIVYVDEFEKVYSNDENEQEEFLPILDGVFQSKKMFIFTSNSIKINEFLKNRPSRIRYLRRYEGLTRVVVDEIIEDRLTNKAYKEELIQLVDLLSNISMDVLLQVIEEINLHDEPPMKTVRYMNVQVEHAEFDVMMYIDGKRRTSKVYYNPLTVKRLYVDYREVDDRNREVWRYYEQNTDSMSVVATNGNFIFTDKDGNEFTFTASKPFEFNL